MESIMSQGSGKKEYKPKYSNKIEYSEFKTDYGTHHMIHFPINVNEDTGYGKMFGLGAGKLRAIIGTPQAIIEAKAHLEKYPDEGVTQIKVDDHVGNEWDN
jgi:hypothetical protein